MAEDMDSEEFSVSNQESDTPVPVLSRDNTLDCAICLQPFVQPVKLPCSHTFCFLCAKGIALQRRPCALCRTDIPINFLSAPDLFRAGTSKSVLDEKDAADRHVWFYQGHKGWWQYDHRTCADIEQAYANEEKSVDILIAGAIYIIDFENMIQYQRNLNSRKRKIKRDKITAEKKGVAGITESDDSSSSNKVAQGQSATRQSTPGGTDSTGGSGDAKAVGTSSN